MAEWREAATLRIKDAANMTEGGRKEISKWLRKEAKALAELGDKYSPNFRARYMYQLGDVTEDYNGEGGRRMK